MLQEENISRAKPAVLKNKLHQNFSIIMYLDLLILLLTEAFGFPLSF